jgi:hypothetical protein
MEILQAPSAEIGAAARGVLEKTAPWTVMNQTGRKIEAVVGFGYRLAPFADRDLVPAHLVEHVGVEISAEPVGPKYPGQYVVTVLVKDLDSGKIISAPRITAQAGREATVRSGFTSLSGAPTEFRLKVVVGEDGSGASCSWEMTRDGTVVASHSAEFKL